MDKLRRQKIRPTVEHVFQVESEVVARDGGSDAHYSLCGIFTATELATVLKESLERTVKDTLLRGGTTPVGHELHIVIRDRP